MIAFIIVMILLAAMGVLGFVVKSLLWLAIVAIILFVLGGIFGFTKFGGSNRA